MYDGQSVGGRSEPVAGHPVWRQLSTALPIGVAGALGVGRLLQSVIVKTNGRDVLLIGAIALLMIVVSLAACIWPARRAMRLDPVSALRRD